MYDNLNGEQFVSADFHGQDQADLGRLFLPDYEPESTVGWPSGDLLSQEIEEDDRTATEYEIERQEAAYDDFLMVTNYGPDLGTEYGSTHDTYAHEWED